jgi:sarcosine oxidase delta subunit
MKGTKAANEKMLLCPFCGNTHQEEFTVLHETRSIGAS